MPKTCNSALTPYATPQDFLDTTDERVLGDLVRDDGSQATPTDLLTDGRLAKALGKASGLVETFALAGQRYSAADLQALVGNARDLLEGMVCGLAIQYLRNRRGVIEPGTYPQYDAALKLLDMLGEGKTIFPFAETEAAGLAVTEPMRPADFYQGLPTLVTNWTRCFGVRANRRYPR